MSVVGASCFLLLGAAVLLIDLRTSGGGWPAQWLALPVAGASFVVILGFAYNASSLYHFLPGGKPAALQGMILFLLLVAGVLLARPDRGLVAQLRAPDAAGFLARRLLPAAVLVPPVVGWFRWQGEVAGLYGTEVGLALFATANVAIFSFVIWMTAAAVGRAEALRLAAEAKVHAQLARMDLLNHITRAISERQDVQSVFQVVVRSIEDNLPIHFGCIALYDPAAEAITVESVGIRSEALAGDLALLRNAEVPVDRNGLSRCLQGTLVYEPDITGSTFPFPQRLARGGLRSLVIAPLRAESSVFGVLIAARREPGSFSSGDCEFLRQLAEHVALATRQSQLYGELQSAYQDLRSSQEAVVQQERLRALGQMASGMAHDINNALSPAALYTESLLEREAGLTADGREKLTVVQRALDDVVNTVSRTRQFYGQRELQLRLVRVNLNELARQVLELTRARWRDQPQGRGLMIEVRTEFDEALDAVTGAESEIRDALTNLVFNAVDAMPQGGTLTLRTRTLHGMESDGSPSARRACIEVSDTGTGMDEDTRRRCLEPFFTTKGERGSGLGLAMVYGMVQRHSAELELDSAVGVGTTVRLIFQIAATTESTSDTAGLLAPARRLNLLVVDDDPLLTRSLRDTLEADGHVVVTADGGEAGINTFIAARKKRTPFDLVITDLGMPYVDGRKVAARIRAEAATVPIILLTGWGQRLLSENDIPANVDRVLAKPPKVRELRAALAQLTVPGRK
jgi:signal transduction histidine kinase/CheY-like chemotaxis protein